MVIEQAIYGAQDAGGYRFLARSPGFHDAWLPEAQRLCTGFGERPAGVACPACVFAQPLGPKHVAVVQAADQGSDDAGRPGALGFRLLVLPAALYDQLGGDPFYIADQFPPDWRARGDLPSLEWSAGPPPARAVEDVQKVLDVPHSATLLGGAQALLDGSRLVFERSAPDAHLLRSLWMLLPSSTRRDLWPASFVFANSVQFHALVVPRADGPDFAGYIDEEKAGDYPQGAYELHLQRAVEAGDAAEMEDLFAGRTRRSPWLMRVIVGLVALLFFNVPFALMWLSPPSAAPPPSAPAVQAPGKAEKPILQAADSCPPLDGRERQQLAQRLQRLAAARHLDISSATTDEALTDDIEKIDKTLQAPDSARDPGRLRDLGPVQRQLRALLWKHGVAGYDASGLNTVEMVEKLEEHLVQR